jgi:hypothetical protein
MRANPPVFKPVTANYTSSTRLMTRKYENCNKKGPPASLLAGL